MSKIGKRELVDEVAEATGQTKQAVATAFDVLLTNIGSHIASGNQVTLPGIGALVAAKTAARTGRDPRNGAPVQIAERYVVRFKASTTLKALVN